MKEVNDHTCHDNHQARNNYPFAGVAIHNVKLSSKTARGLVYKEIL
jgi:hypothetical protein